MSEVRKIQVSEEGIKDLLNQGYSRAKIAEHYNVPVAAVNTLFKHPKLAGLRAKKASAYFVLAEESNEQKEVTGFTQMGSSVENVVDIESQEETAQEEAVSENISPAPTEEVEEVAVEQQAQSDSWTA